MISLKDLIVSSKNKTGLVSNEEIVSIVNKTIKKTKVKITSVNFNDLEKWEIKDGIISRKDKAFFSIRGLKEYKDDFFISEQPIIIQNEIGYLGFICKKINGILYFLIQLKIEPGNINTIQISPTIQATKSNFEQKHGGKKPKYFEYFANKNKYYILADQIQSEQNSRFLSKRNRNIIIEVEDDFEIYENFYFLTLGQIKDLMKIDNLVNMDTRTILSCIQYIDKFNKDINFFDDDFMYHSIVREENLSNIYSIINDYKMFSLYKRDVCTLNDLKYWKISQDSITNDKSNFSVIFCNIEIEGREVNKWSQPLFKSNGPGLFGLIRCKKNDEYLFLIKLKHECGIFDIVELGPTIQLEYQDLINNNLNGIEKQFINLTKEKNNVLIDVMLSEEGGRFYHEQNRNIIINVSYEEIQLTDNYIWVNYNTLNRLVLFNNVLNIQLRNLLSLIEVH